MKSFLPLLLFLLYRNTEVSCYEVQEYVSEKYNELKGMILSAITYFKYTFDEMKAEPEPNDYIIISRRGRDGIFSKSIKSFSEFVEQEAGRSEWDSSEYYNLRSEPTALMSTPQLATFHGRSIESYTVVTDDRYILTLHRLPAPRSKGLTILMHHGLLGSSADWILMGPNKSLPYILSDTGCDVWLANARGNYYSRGHTKLKIDSPEYWEFSFQEMGAEDLPAVVKYIKKFKNDTDQLYFIGHSMGATAFLTMLSVHPIYNKYFSAAILLAPLVYMANVKGPLRRIVTSNKTENLLQILRQGEFSPSRTIPLWFGFKHCKGADLYCINPLLFLSSSIPDEYEWSTDFTARVLYHVPAGGSSRTILHYARMVKTGKFQNYTDNKEYPLRPVEVPIAIFSSNDDALATKEDVAKLFSEIPNRMEHNVVSHPEFTHMDFVWHPEADRLVFSKVLKILQIT